MSQFLLLVATKNFRIRSRVGLGQRVWLNIRYWDGQSNAWYDALDLPILSILDGAVNIVIIMTHYLQRKEK